MMRQALKQSALFVIGLLLIVNGLALLSRTVAPTATDDFLQRDRNNMKRLQQTQAEAEILVLGNSHAASLDFAALDRGTGVALGRASADLFELNYSIRALLDDMPDLQTVFITVSYFAFDRDNVNVDLTYYQTRRTHLYMTTPATTPIAGDWGRLILAKSQPIFPIVSVLREDNWYSVFTELLSGNVANAAPLPTEDVGRNCVFDSAELRDQISYDTAIRHLDVSDRMLKQNPQLADETYAVLADTIALLQTRSIEVVLYTPPYYAPYTDYFLAEGGAAQLAQTQQRVAQLQADYGVAYYDFSAETTIASDYNLFGNSDHLNDCGREVFSTLLADTLQDQ